MNAQQFLEGLIDFLRNLEKGVVFESWVYNGPTTQSFGTPSGSWDSNKYAGFEFYSMAEDENYRFIIRPVPVTGQNRDLSYLVIESISTQSQLANLRLDSSKYQIRGERVTIIEDFTMTVGLGRKATHLVKSKFLQHGFRSDGQITTFGTTFGPNYDKIIINILDWATYRERVKIEFQNENDTNRNESIESKTLRIIETPPISIKDGKSLTPIPGTTELAQELGKLLINLRPEPGMMVGLFGKWGRGKTFLYDELTKLEEINDKFFPIIFHAWKHQDTPASWAYLYENLSKEYYDEPTWFLPKAWRVIKLNWKRENKFWLIVFVITFLSAFLLNICNVFKDEIMLLTLTKIGQYGSLGIITYQFVNNYIREHTKNATDIFKKYASKHSFKELLGMQAEIQKELEILLSAWLGKKAKKRVLLFVDDIDRCDEKHIIQIVDSLRVMLENNKIAKHVIVLSAVDERILSRTIKLKYKDLIDNKGNEFDVDVFTREYIDKLFIAGIKLGKLNSSEKDLIYESITEKMVEQNYEKPDSTPKPVSDAVKKGLEKIQNESHKNISDHLLELERVEFLISKAEQEITREIFTNIENITPRQIRILFYRYLLGRDLLKNLFEYYKWNEKDTYCLASIIVFAFYQYGVEKDIIELIESDLSVNNGKLDKKVQDYWTENVDDNYKSVLKMIIAY